MGECEDLRRSSVESQKLTTSAYWRGIVTPVDVGEGRIEGIPCLSRDCRVAALEAALQALVLNRDRGYFLAGLNINIRAELFN